jgi:hypothetical protein
MTKLRSQRRKISLDSCWAKIHRTTEHQDELDDYIRETFSIDQNCPAVGFKFDPKTGEDVLYISRMPRTPRVLVRVGVLLGDAFHDLRSALDHLTWQLAHWNTQGQINHPRKVQFPICETPPQFARAEAESLGEVHARHRAIIERFQPYRRLHGGGFRTIRDHPLTMLKQFSDTDKHRIFNTVVMPTKDIRSASRFSIMMYLAGVFGRTTVSVGFIELGTELVRTKVPNRIFHADMKVAGHIVPEIAFPQKGAVIPVVEALDQIGAMVTGIVRAFKPFS